MQVGSQRDAQTPDIPGIRGDLRFYKNDLEHRNSAHLLQVRVIMRNKDASGTL